MCIAMAKEQTRVPRLGRVVHYKIFRVLVKVGLRAEAFGRLPTEPLRYPYRNAHQGRRIRRARRISILADDSLGINRRPLDRLRAAHALAGPLLHTQVDHVCTRK